MKLAIATLLLLTAPAYGLDLRDTMQQWKQAPIEARAQVLKDILSDRGEIGVINRNSVMTCMNQVANTRLLLPKRVLDMIEYCIKGDDETEYIR